MDRKETNVTAPRDEFAGHTPGPWRYEQSTRTLRAVPGNHWLATINSFDGTPDHDANASLMAAAPDLLQERNTLRAENAKLREELAGWEAPLPPTDADRLTYAEGFAEAVGNQNALLRGLLNDRRDENANLSRQINALREKLAEKEA